MFFSLGTLRAVDIKKLSMRLRTPPHSLTKPRFKLSPRHFAEASTAGRSHIWSHQLEPFPSHLCILRTQQSAQRGASKSKATWMKDADTTLYDTEASHEDKAPASPTFQSWERAGKTWHLKDRGPKGWGQTKYALQTRFYSRCDGKAMEDLHREVKLTHKPLLKLSPILPETLFPIIFQMLKDTNAWKSNSKITN